MLSRLGLVLLFLTGTAVALAYYTGVGFTIPVEKAVRADIEAAASPTAIDQKIVAALERDNIEDADLYLEIANFMNYELPPSTRGKLDEAHTLSATVVRNTWEFGEGFATGQGDTDAGIAGALSSDRTVVGNVRDISAEGGKMLGGEDYDELVLGLSVVSFAGAETAGKTGDGAKDATALIKTAVRTNRLTKEFADALTDLTNEALDLQLLRETLRTTDLHDLAKTQTAIAGYSRTIRAAKLRPVLECINQISAAIGSAETLRLMKFAHTTNDLADLREIARKFGAKSRGILELTGKTNLHAFKTSFRVTDWIAASATGFLAWTAGLIALLFTRGMRFTASGRALL